MEAPSHSARDADDLDQGLIAEVREMSLRDAGVRERRPRAGSSRSRHPERHTVSGSRERRLEEARRRRRAERQLAAPPPPRTAAELATQESRQIEHQSSLRSLLSASDGDSAIEEEILRQITEEGLLDGIDLRNLSPSQEDELSERIADAYRRRFFSHYMNPPLAQNAEQNRRRQPQHGTEGTQRTTARRTRSRSPARNDMGSTSQLLIPETSSQMRGVSSPRAASERGTRRRRTSPSPRTGPSISSDAVISPATRSSTDIPRPPRSSRTSLPVAPSHRRATSSASETGRRTLSEGQRRHARSRSTDHRTQVFQQVASPTVTMSPTSASDTPSAPTTRSNTGLQDIRPRHETPDSPLDRRIAAVSSSSRPSSSRSEVSPRPEPRRYPEPSIACERCGKHGIQYEVYKHCKICNNGNYNVCLPCYRAGHSCLHWFGFGYRAQINFQRKFPPSQGAPTPEPPHTLASRKYIQPSPGTVQQGRDGADRTSTEDPDQRLQEGMFCDMCHSFADDCFWKCRRCNDGEWGFCNRCVNRGHCCTHPLLPITRANSDAADIQQPGVADSAAVLASPPVPEDSNYRALAMSTKCSMCTYPIPPSTTRFHCPECNDGDYDICTNCYLKLCASGKISKENGRNGWRRCPTGHRMIIVGFEDREDGQRRVIVKGLVGGFAMRDTLDPSSPATPSSAQNLPTPSTDPDAPSPPVRQDSGNWTWKDSTDTGNTSRRRRINRSRHHWTSGADPSKPTASTIPSFPPSGGIGLNCLAIWSCYPNPEDTDEIMFPRGAIITEAENINDDWLWGCYAGQKGLFPGGYVRVLEQVGTGGLN